MHRRERPIVDGVAGREQVLERMERVMGPLPDRSGPGPVDVEVLEDVDLGDVLRRKITYSPEPG